MSQKVLEFLNRRIFVIVGDIFSRPVTRPRRFPPLKGRDESQDRIPQPLHEGLIWTDFISEGSQRPFFLLAVTGTGSTPMRHDNESLVPSLSSHSAGSQRPRRVDRRPRKSRLLQRRARFEALESRRVLAATVTAFNPTPSGFTAELSEQIQTNNLSLYDAENGLAGDADVTLVGSSSGNIRGSLFVNGTTITFVATGGRLAPDTYTATLRSASDAFVDLADGELLDGDNNSVAGGNFVDTFTVTGTQDLVVGLPDFARGPTQTVQVPAGGSGQTLPPGLPIQLSDADGVTSVTLTIEYDPTLLDISAVQLGGDAPTDSQVESNLSTPGVATISFFSVAPMSSGQADIVDIIATVPEDATYGAAQAIRITSIEVNAGDLDAATDDAIHVVAFPGDANRNRRYDAEDARLIARVGVDLDTGFVFNNPTATSASTRLYPAIDPILIGDVTGVDGISPLDSSDILRQVVGLSTPNIPALPDAQAPTGISLSTTTINDAISIGTTVATLSTSDPDTGDTHTYSLVTGTGDGDNSSFTISGNSLVSAETFDASSQSTLTIRVQSTDSTGRSIQRVFTLTVEHTNVAPTAIALSNASIAEDAATQTTIGTLSTTDADSGDTHTYEVVSVDGNTSSTEFSISGNALQLGTALDFETKSSYSVVVRSTDAGGLSVTQTFTISVTDVNESPTALALSNSTVGDNAAVGTVVGVLSTTDVDSGDTHTYTLVSGTGDTDNASFTIAADELRTAAALDFGSQSSYSVRVRTTDSGGETFEQTFVITLGNSAPSAVALDNDTIAENSGSATTVGTLTTTDANSTDTHSYTLVSGDGDTDNASFTISGDQLVTADSFDFETQNSYSIRVRSTDPSSLFVEQILTITVSDVNEAATQISLSNSSVADGEPSGTTIGTLSSDDPDVGDTLTYTLTSGTGDTDNTSFTISGDQLITAFTASQSTQASYSIRVQVEDGGGLSTEQVFTITVTGQNVAPTAIALDSTSIAEDAAIDATVGTFSTTDANSTDTFTYSLVAGTGDTDNASFSIDGDTLTLNTVLDFETKDSYTVRVRSTDTFGLFTEQDFTISVTNVNEAATELAIDSDELASGQPSGTTVGTLSSNDPDSGDTITFTLVSGDGDTDNASFTISGDELTSAFTSDFTQQTSYSVRVRGEDAGGLSVEQVFVITVTEVNVAPTAITLSSNSVDENVSIGTAVGTLGSTDANTSDSHTYTLVTGDGDTDNASFTINGDQLELAVSPDFETQSSYSIRVRSTDSGGLNVEEMFTITVSNVNESATAITLDSAHVADGEASGTIVGTFGNDDPDDSDTFTYSFVAGTDDTDNGEFTISGNQLLTAFVANQSTKDTYSIRVSVIDAGGLATESVFSINITETNVAPTAIDLSESSIDENVAGGTTIGTMSATDANSSDTHAFELVAGTGDADNALFSISGNELQNVDALDFETQSSYSIRVRATDNFGESFEQAMTITVNDVNEQPGSIDISFANVADGEPADTIVGDLLADDPDAGDSLTFSLVSGDGDDDNAAFKIENGQLVTTQAVDDAIQSLYSVRVRALDTGGLFSESVITIDVSETNVAPSAIVLSNDTLPTSAAVGTVVGQLSATDSNQFDQHTFTLVAGTGDTDNASFTIEDNELKTAIVIDSGSPSSFSIRVLCEDHYGLTVEQIFTITVQ